MSEGSGPRSGAWELSQHECVSLLARNHIGRVAFAVDGRVDIQPLHYVYEAGWIYGRTSEGSKLVALDRDHRVAFETDEPSGPAGWASVVVHGSFHRLHDDADARERAAAVHAAVLLRAVVPETLRAEDPVPARTVLFRIAIGGMTGRAGRPG